MAKARELSPKEEALLEMEDAKSQLENAMQMFNYAEPEFFEVANAELTAAEARYKAVSKRLHNICSEINISETDGTVEKYPHRASLRGFDYSY